MELVLSADQVGTGLIKMAERVTWVPLLCHQRSMRVSKRAEQNAISGTVPDLAMYSQNRKYSLPQCIACA